MREGEMSYARLVNHDFICHGAFDPRLHAGTEHAMHHRTQREPRAQSGDRLVLGHRFVVGIALIRWSEFRRCFGNELDV